MDIMKSMLILIFSISLYANSNIKNSDETISMVDANFLITEGNAKVITKEKMNQIKKKNIQLEISDLGGKKVLVNKEKKKSVDLLEQERGLKLAELNRKYNEKRVGIENFFGTKIEEIGKMVTAKESEIALIEKIAALEKRVKVEKKRATRIITISDTKNLKKHIRDTKNLSNVIMKLSLVNSFELYIDSLKKDWNYGVKKRIKDYLLKVAFDNKDIDYDNFEIVVKNANTLELKKILEILKNEMGA